MNSARIGYAPFIMMIVHEYAHPGIRKPSEDALSSAEAVGSTGCQATFPILYGLPTICRRGSCRQADLNTGLYRTVLRRSVSGG
jgi:hypothetical protein